MDWASRRLRQSATASRSRRLDAPDLAGTVVDVDPRWVALVLDRPAPGTAFLAVEGDGEHVTVSIWSYLYGPDGAAAAERDDPRWRQWLAERAAL